MASILDSFKEKFADTKSRTVLILVTAILLIGAVVAIVSKKSQQTLDGSISSARVSQLGVVGGGGPATDIGHASEEYNQLQYKDNAKRADEASKDGKSSVPTLVSDQVVDSVSPEEARRRELDKLAREREDAYKKLMDQRKREEMLAAQRQAQQDALAAQAAGQQEQAALMNGQAQALLAKWAIVPDQKLEAGQVETTASGSSSGGSSGGAIAPSGGAVMYKAGDIIFAVALTEVNSDEAGPVMARIVQGPLKGAKVVGGFKTVGKKLRLDFNLLNIPSAQSSMSFNVTAIDPDTARTAIATDVDNHYLLKYGSMMGSAFLEGMSNAVLASLNNKGLRDESGVVTVESLRSTTKEQVIAGFGNVGTKIAEETDFSDIKPTIKIAAGTGFGLLFNSDFSLGAAASGGGQTIKETTAAGSDQLNALQQTVDKILEASGGADALLPSTK